MSDLRYTSTAISLHWLMAILILVSFSVGLYMSGLALSPTKLKLYSWHKWAGVTIFLLAVFRLAWRTRHPPPPLPTDMPHWQRRTATAAHYALYALILVIPVSGWLMSSAKGMQTVYFGVLPLPDLIDKNKELGHLLESVHTFLNYSMLAIIVVHVAAALKHHFVDKDTILRRMLSSKRV